MYDNRNPRGFIALMSAVIISAILLTATVTGSLTGFYTRFNILDSELKKRSSALAEACADVVLYRLLEDPAYAGPSIGYPVGSDTCNIYVANNPSESLREFRVQGVYQNSYTNLKLSVDVDSISIVSWQEVAQ